MINEDVSFYLAASIFVAAFFSISSIYGSMFIWFKWIKKIESMLGAPGTAIWSQKSFWEGLYIGGRFHRVLLVFHYFTFLKIPILGKKIAERAGKETVPISQRDRYIGFALAYIFLLGGLYFLIVGWTLMKVALV